MHKRMSFQDALRGRFQYSWAFRNWLTNYYVFWEGKNSMPDPGLASDLHKFLQKNHVFNASQYEGFCRLLEADGILSELETDPDQPGLLNEDHADFLKQLVDEEYQLDWRLPRDKGEKTSSTVASLLWDIGQQKNHHAAGDLMLGTVSKLFNNAFGDLVKQTTKTIDERTYLFLTWDEFTWPITFVARGASLNDRYVVYDVYSPFANKIDPTQQFPTICANFFGDRLVRKARDLNVQLLQMSSLFRFMRWVREMVQECGGEITTPIANNLQLLLQGAQIPLSSGEGIIRIMESYDFQQAYAQIESNRRAK